MTEQAVYDQEQDTTHQTKEDKFSPAQYAEALLAYQKNNPLQDAPDFWEWSWNAGYVLAGFDGKNQDEWAKLIYDQFYHVYTKFQASSTENTKLGSILSHIGESMFVGILTTGFIASLWAVTFMLFARWYGGFIGLDPLGFFQCLGPAVVAFAFITLPSMAGIASVHTSKPLSSGRYASLQFGYWAVATLTLWASTAFLVF